MKKMINKRKINRAKTLEKRMVHKKFRVGPFVQVTKKNKIRKQKKSKLYSTGLLTKKKKMESTVRVLSVSCSKNTMV